jgi:hypothetical protein
VTSLTVPERIRAFNYGYDRSPTKPFRLILSLPPPNSHQLDFAQDDTNCTIITTTTTPKSHSYFGLDTSGPISFNAAAKTFPTSLDIVLMH